MANNKKPTVVQTKVFNTDELSRQADPDWVKERNYLPAYKFDDERKVFIDHRDRVYDHPKADE